MAAEGHSEEIVVDSAWHGTSENKLRAIVYTVRSALVMVVV